MGKIIAIFLGLCLFLAVPAVAQDKAAPAKVAGEAAPVAEEAAPDLDQSMGREGRTSSGLPIPRFVTLASEKVFVRTGPALRYPIKWIYQKEHLPVEVIQEFDTWRKIRDMDGDDGWIHQSLLSGERAVIIKGEQKVAVYKDASENSRMQALLEPNVIAMVAGCNGLWCDVSAQGYRGYAQRKFLWGIYDQEDFD